MERVPSEADSSVRFSTLDGLRGVASLCVAAYHFGVLAHLKVLEHAYMAVDFFFVLSGFVLAWTYERRLATSLSWRRFALARIIRLYPLVILSTACAAGAFLFGINSLKLPAPLPSLFCLGILLTPLLTTRQPHDLFPLNGPEWSLCDELIVNLGWGAIAARLKTRVMVGIIALTGICYVALSMRFHTLHVGYANRQFIVGILRTMAAFGMGILVARLYRQRAAGRVIGSSAMAAAASSALIAAFSLPVIPHVDRILSLLCMFAGFPMLVFVGAQTVAGPRTTAFMNYIGELSYPLYLVHYPIMASAVAIVSQKSSPPNLMMTGAAAIIVAIALAYLLNTLDKPLRKWLRHATHQRASAVAQTAP